MFRKLAAITVSALASMLVFVAYTGVSANCWFTTYEPDIPESLKHGD
ncbi:MAG: cyclic lactone autoinducer peptide [Firmicutes bacterium]|nr:cyclic lactone autoinducer peptide [Bacillota bacterium]